MQKDKSVENVLTREHNAVCSKCSKKQPDLRSLKVNWIPCLSKTVDTSDPSYKYQTTTFHNMADIRVRRYYLCDSCGKKESMRKLIYVLLGVLLCLVLPIIYLIEQNTSIVVIKGYEDAANPATWIFGLALGIVLIVINIPTKKRVYDRLSRNQLETDMVNGKFEFKVSWATANEAKIWTELCPEDSPLNNDNAE